MVFHALVMAIQEVVIQAYILFEFLDTRQMVGAYSDFGFQMVKIVADFIVIVFGVIIFEVVTSCFQDIFSIAVEIG